MSDHVKIRLWMVEALGQIGDARAVEPLIGCLGDADWRVRDSAADALGKIGEPAVEGLIGCLTDEDSLVRASAAETLGNIGNARAVEPLIACLGDENSDVRRSAAWALGDIGDARAVEPLIASLRDADSLVRASAARALGKIGWQPQTEDQEIQYLVASQNWVKLAEKGQATVEALIAYLRDADKHLEVRRSAAIALGKIGDARAVEALIACLRDEDMRRSAAWALGDIGDVRAVEPLIACLRDEDKYVRRSAAEASGKIGDARAVEPLIASLRDADKDVRRSAATALGKIGWQPQTEDQEMQYLVASQNWVKLAEKGEATVEALIAYLRDADKHLESAAEALGKIGEPAVEPLIGCLNDDVPLVRAFVVSVLGEIGSHQAIQSIMPLLNDFAEFDYEDETYRVCDIVYYGLQDVGTPDALKACADWVAAGNEPQPID